MIQDRKTYAKNDILLLGDFQTDKNPQTDTFKLFHFPKPT